MTVPTAPAIPPATESTSTDRYAAAFATARPELEKIQAAAHEGDDAVRALFGEPAPTAPEEPKPEEPKPEEPTTEPPEGGGVAAPELHVVALPPRREGEATREVAFDDQGTAEWVQHLAKTYRRTEALDAERREVEREREEASTLLDEFRVDPLGMLEADSDPTDRADIALHLLANQDVLAAAGERLQALMDPDRSGEVRVGLREQRIAAREATHERLARARTVRQAERETYRLIDGLAPSNLTEADYADYRALVEGDLRRAIAGQQGRIIPPREVPRILRPRLLRMGMTDEQIAERLEALAGGQRPPRRASATPVHATTPPTPAERKAAVDARPVTGAPPGVGVPAVQGFQVPKGTRTEQAIALLKQRLTAPRN